MSPWRALVVGLAGLGACSRGYDDGYAIDLVLRAASELDDATLARVKRLAIAVDGAERADASYAVDRPFARAREERVVYRPLVRSGRIRLAASGSDAAGTILAQGSIEVTLAYGTTRSATLTLVRPLPPAIDAARDASGDAALDGPLDFCALPANDGLPCGGGDTCHDAPRCVAGACTRQPRPDGYPASADPLERCCGGAVTRVDTATACGACGIRCQSGHTCQIVGAAWQCTCSSGADCWSGCCRTTGLPAVCEPSTCSVSPDCVTCPGNATCTVASPYAYCHY